ncbi:MAG: type II secretion system protein [Patescibacteria group bacterium]
MRKVSAQYFSGQGFTLMELLISISLIAILTGVLLAVLNPRGIQAKARDSQRISDLSKVKVALESYFSDNRGYPISAGWVAVTSLSTAVPLLSPTYINTLPEDPKKTGTLCSGANWRGYAYKSDGVSYLLVTNVEVASMGTTGCPNTVLAGGCNCSSGIAYYATAD